MSERPKPDNDEPSRRIGFDLAITAVGDEALRREWLVANGLGGYASGTIGGMATRRYHGLLVAALPAPLGRRMLLTHLEECLRRADGRLVVLSHRMDGPSSRHIEAQLLEEFRLERGLPVWRYQCGDVVLEKRIVMPHEQNTVHVVYRLLEGPEAVELELRLAIQHRSHDDPVSRPLPEPFRLVEREGYLEFVVGSLPPLRVMAHARRHAFTIERREFPDTIYSIEKDRGYEHHGTLFSPGYMQLDVYRGEPAAFVASTESWETVTALTPQNVLDAELERRQHLIHAARSVARAGLPAELVLAADQFMIRPVGRSESEARLHARGDEGRTIIAGYHWFTDWGRDTMISLEGLALITGRHAEARNILRTFAHFVRDGLIPNLFPEGDNEGLYHTADATLWFFHALDRYVAVTGDAELVEGLLDKLVGIANAHVAGTRFGISVDPEDGLLRQGAPGFQLTWMDAKVDDWVVTPRRGKAVELNALWFNALSLLAEWLADAGELAEAARWKEQAKRAHISFNRRFWYETGRHLYDVVDGETGDDPACRPNQVIAISLKHPVLERERWAPVMDIVEERLLTPFGLRTLDPADDAYRASYFGDIHARDAAYHQGTVWPWLLGPFVDAWLKINPDEGRGAARFVEAFDRHLSEACVGSVSEIFDAEMPSWIRR